MKNRTLVAFALAVCVSGGAGFAGAQALQAAEKKTHFEADADELTRTENLLKAHITTASSTMKQIAQETKADDIEAKKQEREQALNAALKPLQDDTLVMLIQAHLLSIDSVADKTGEPAEQFIHEFVYKKLNLEPAEVAKRREATGLGHGGLILGYLTAKVAKLPADQIFTAKEGRSWPEVMRAHKVSVSDVVQVLQDPQQ